MSSTSNTGATVTPYKAVAAYVVSFVVALYASIQGRTDLGDLHLIDWLIIVVGAAAVSGGVYATPYYSKGART